MGCLGVDDRAILHAVRRAVERGRRVYNAAAGGTVAAVAFDRVRLIVAAASRSKRLHVREQQLCGGLACSYVKDNALLAAGACECVVLAARDRADDVPVTTE